MQSRQWHPEGSVILVCVNKHKTPRSSGYERTKKFKSDILVSFHDVGLNLHSIIYRPISIQTSSAPIPQRNKAKPYKWMRYYMRQSLKKLKFKAKVFLFTKIYVSRIKPDCVKPASWCASGNPGAMLNLAKRKGIERRRGGGTWIIFWAKHNNELRAPRLLIEFYCIAECISSTQTASNCCDWSLYEHQCLANAQSTCWIKLEIPLGLGI